MINKALLDEVIAKAINAGQHILEIYQNQTPLDIKTKLDDSPVTQADLLAHQIIVEGLSSVAPGLPILSEEDPDFTYATRKAWDLFWLVDPLDGTREFINRSGQFTVNIALIENFIPILGVVFVPLKNILYFALRGLGSFKVENNGTKQLAVRPWHKGDEIVLVTTRKEMHQDLQEHLLQYGNVNITYRSSSLKFCLVAEGRADIYLRKKPIHEWDTAAGQCILEQAGGVVLDSNWQALRYNTRPHLLNPPFIALGDSKQLLPILRTMPMF